MIQVSWQGRMTTSLPTTDSEVARWVAHDRPEMVRAQTADGTAYRPDAAQVLAFMQAQAHLAQMLRFQYAAAHGLVPAHAGAVLTRPRTTFPMTRAHPPAGIRPIEGRYREFPT